MKENIIDLGDFRRKKDEQKAEALGRDITETRYELKKELAEINLYLELGISKMSKENLLARKEELESLIQNYDKLEEEAQQLS